MGNHEWTRMDPNGIVVEHFSSTGNPNLKDEDEKEDEDEEEDKHQKDSPVWALNS